MSSQFKFTIFLVLLVALTGLSLIFIERDLAEPEQDELGVLPEEITENKGFQFWLESWQSVQPLVSAREFELVSEEEIEVLYTYPENHVDQWLKEPATKRYVFSPDSTKFIDYFESFGEADSSVLIYNRNGKERLERLEFCGTLCGFDYAFWLNNSQFVLAGNSENFFDETEKNDERGQQQQTTLKRNRVLTLYHYDLSQNKKRLYVSEEYFLQENALREFNARRWIESLPDEEKQNWQWLFN